MKCRECLSHSHSWWLVFSFLSVNMWSLMCCDKMGGSVVQCGFFLLKRSVRISLQLCDTHPPHPSSLPCLLLHIQILSRNYRMPCSSIHMCLNTFVLAILSSWNASSLLYNWNPSAPFQKLCRSIPDFLGMNERIVPLGLQLYVHMTF